MSVPGLDESLYMYFIENAVIIPKTGSWFFNLFFETWFDDKRVEKECWFILLMPIFCPLGAFLMFFVPFVMMIETAILLAYCSLHAMVFLAMGIWAGPISALLMTGFSLMRMPHNFCYHAVVTYRTVLLRTNLKIISFILLPFIHLSVPIITLILSFFYFTGRYFGLCVGGVPFKCWQEIPINIEDGKKMFVTDMEKYFENYGHPSGIPAGWNGKVFGLPLDPVVFIIGVGVYLLVVVPFSTAVFFIFIIRTIPILLGTITKFIGILSYFGSKIFSSEDTNQNENPSSPSRTGASRQNKVQSAHASWTIMHKEVAGMFAQGIRMYYSIMPLDKYIEAISWYANLVTWISPRAYAHIFKTTWKDFLPQNTMKCVSEMDWCASIFLLPCLVIPFLLMTFLFLFFSVLVTWSFVLGLITWLAGWLILLPGMPTLYLFIWTVIIVTIPCLYTLFFTEIIIFFFFMPITLSLSGPFIALKIPHFIIKSNYGVYMELGSSIYASLKLALTILKRLDWFTGSLSLGGCTFTKVEWEEDSLSEVDIELQTPGARNEVTTHRVASPLNPSSPAPTQARRPQRLTEYWDLVVEVCRAARAEILSLKWLEEEDIASASAAR